MDTRTHYTDKGETAVTGMTNVGKVRVTDVQVGWVVSDGGFTFNVEYVNIGNACGQTVIAGTIIDGDHHQGQPHARTVFNTHNVERFVPSFAINVDLSNMPCGKEVIRYADHHEINVDEAIARLLSIGLSNL